MIDKTKTSWLQRNVDRVLADVAKDARKQKPLPFGIKCSPEAFRVFMLALKSKSAFFPEPDGSFKLLGIPVKINTRIPAGTFVVERFGVPAMISQGIR